MSLALIEESAKEVRRLAIAGSPLAVGDFRIKKLIAPLEQAGAKVPVFAQVAKAITELVNGTEAESATRLLALSTLLNAILYTQGQASTGAAFADIEVFATNCSCTRTTARALKPLIAALTNAGGGRFEIIKSACERGACNDLRLIDPAIQALGDSHPEMADLVAKKILPGYGPGIVPRLKLGFDLKGKKSGARRLKVMHQLDSAGTLELCKGALEDGSPDVKAAAVECLGQHEECLPLVMEQANSKNKIVRAAALETLAEHDRPEIVKLFGDLIKGSAFDILARPFRAIRSAQVLRSLLDEGKQAFESVLRGDEAQQPRFWEILGCLDQRSRNAKKEIEVEQFVIDCFLQSEKLAKIKPAKNFSYTGTNFVGRLSTLPHIIGTPRALETLLSKRELLSPVSTAMIIRSALSVWTPEKVFEEFSPLLRETKGVGKEKREQLRGVFWAAQSRDFPFMGDESDSFDEARLREIKWDPRWLDAAIKADELVIVCCLARKDHSASIKYLLKATEGKDQTRANLIVQTLARCEYPKVTEAFLDLVARCSKSAKYFDYQMQSLFEAIRYLPPGDLPKLDAFAAKLDEKFVDRYLEALEPLRPVNSPNQS